MKKTFTFGFIVLAFFMISSQIFAQSDGEDFSTFIKGADMTWARINDDGHYPWGSPYDTLVKYGFNYVRLSVWYDPPSSDWQHSFGRADSIMIEAKKAHDKGLKVELDIWYSDEEGSKPVPTAWQTAWNNAHSGNPNWNNGSNTKALKDSVYNYTYRLVKAFSDYGAPVNMVSVGNEIQSYFCQVPRQTQVYYELLYKGCRAVKDFDPNIGVVLHLANIGSNQMTECDDIINAASRWGVYDTHGDPADIPFDCFGFSFHPFSDASGQTGNPLDNSNWPGKGVIGLQQAFWNSNFGQFGKYLLVQEAGWPHTLDPVTVTTTDNPYAAADSTFNPRYSDSTDFRQHSTYQCGPYGAHLYYGDMMSIVASTQHGIGVVAWAADNVVGWGRSPQMFQDAFWYDKTGKPVATRNGTVVMSAFNAMYKINRSNNKNVDKQSVPTKFSLIQNYPNPFNPTTMISYSIPVKGFVSLKIYNTLGQEVADLVDGNKEAGSYNINFDGSKLASGVYLYRLQANKFIQTKKMILLK
jgi:Glycosyl hydrolase family 53/Secretion system C-terminal sorting domain